MLQTNPSPPDPLPRPWIPLRAKWRRGTCLLSLLLTASLLGGCAGISRAPHSPRGYREVGVASWYGPKFHGRTTASGERYNMLDYTAAHRSLPFDTLVRVTRLDTGRAVVVRINDRGPFVRGRILDLSYAAARSLGTNREGVVRVRIEVIGPGKLEGNSGAIPGEKR